MLMSMPVDTLVSVSCCFISRITKSSMPFMMSAVEEVCLSITTWLKKFEPFMLMKAPGTPCPVQSTAAIQQALPF